MLVSSMYVGLTGMLAIMIGPTLFRVKTCSLCLLKGSIDLGI